MMKTLISVGSSVEVTQLFSAPPTASTAAGHWQIPTASQSMADHLDRRACMLQEFEVSFRVFNGYVPKRARALC
eukprot:CAMPEP_0172020624 /NCGR_PEP_ID=MMETSP1041-20130122/13288_1 /TAXON_ID=464988 /ORGANISM="Hemiselmis andersenii, Strain CCMP439" /LENGTH=73 /DNA_ID=CAMNT_0012675915 /DNA_START=479 /DNA_END=700 /DNA_ORIENTATION=+